jgi:hypothetical protein
MRYTNPSKTFKNIPADNPARRTKTAADLNKFEKLEVGLK